MGHHVGYSHHVLHVLRVHFSGRPQGVPRAMGPPNDPGYHSLLRALFDARKSKVSTMSYTNVLSDLSRWLARNDRWEDCHHVLALVHAKGNRDAPFIMHELQEIRDMCEFERRNSDVSYLELFKPHMINRTHIGVFTQIWSQLTVGIFRNFVQMILTVESGYECDDVLYCVRFWNGRFDW